MASAKETQIKDEKVAIIGSGLIGRSWAMLFAAAGYKVCIYDIEPNQVTDALSTILISLQDLKKQGLLRGTLSVEQQHGRITGSTDLAETVKDAKYLQECVPEQLELKKSVFKKIDALVGTNTILASSTSSMPCSMFTSDLTHKDQCIVSHPTNPPFYCPLTEVCPASYTRPDVTSQTMDILKETGQEPVLLKKEVLGFVLNRIQYQLMMECWRLIQDDVMTVSDLDKVTSDGLGLRYAFVGPLETCHLNGQGFLDYCDRFGDMIYDVCKNFGPVPRMEGPVAEQINKELCEDVPEEDLAAKRRWRDERLTALAKLKLDMAAEKAEQNA